MYGIIANQMGKWTLKWKLGLCRGYVRKGDYYGRVECRKSSVRIDACIYCLPLAEGEHLKGGSMFRSSLRQHLNFERHTTLAP